jgi:hypothetical protein
MKGFVLAVACALAFGAEASAQCGPNGCTIGSRAVVRNGVPHSSSQHYGPVMGSSQCGPGGCSNGERIIAINGVPVSSSPQQATVTGSTQCGPGGCSNGERIIAINGVPVSSSPQQGTVTGPVRVVGHMAHAVGRTVSGVMGRVVNRDAAAFAHAQREAQLLASRGTVGHPLGVAPGCRYSGTGTSFSPDQPNHCYADEMPESRLVARAMAQGRDGKTYWSAHYR